MHLGMSQGGYIYIQSGGWRHLDSSPALRPMHCNTWCHVVHAVRSFRANLTIPSDALPDGFKSIFLAPRGPFATRLLERLQTGACPKP